MAYLWKVNDEIIKTEKVKLSLTENGVNNVEFWGKYVSGKMEYIKVQKSFPFIQIIPLKNI